jgi:HAMP domain-containing protein
MRVRHKIPSVFSLAMVDVLCCALGCVILLWLIGLRETRDIEDESRLQSLLALHKREEADEQARLTGEELIRAREHSQLTGEELERARTLTSRTGTELKRTGEALARAEADNQNFGNLVLDLYDQLDKAKAEKDKQTKALQGQIVVVGDLMGQLTVAEGRVLNLNNEVKAANDNAAKLSAQIVVLTQRLDKATQAGVDANALAAQVPKLQMDLKRMSEERDKAEAGARDTRTRLEMDLKKIIGERESAEAGARVARSRLEEALKEVEKLKSQVAKGELQAKALQEQVTNLETEVNRLRGLVANLEKEIRSLRDQFRTAKPPGEERFAGLPLTGKNVVFIVDKSGSMVAVGPNEPAPDKWDTVCTSVGKVMDSLPDLAQFQVIVFSDQPRFLFGKDSGWIKFDKATSPGEVRTRLLDLLKTGEVDGGTNMYAPFELAFRFRNNPQPLDTIYLFSDGLPNDGPGVPPDEILRLWNGRKNGVDADRMELGRRLGDHLRNQMRKEWNKPRIGQKFGPVRINTLGFYYESADLGAFLWALARDNDGGFVGMSKP